MGIIDSPIFWLALVLIEGALPMIIPNRRLVGVLMLLIGIFLCAQVSGLLILSQIRFPDFNAPLGLVGAIKLLAVMLAAMLIAMAYWAIREWSLQEQLEDLADAIGDFSSDLQGRIPNAQLLPSDRERWSRVQRDYRRQQFGRRAKRLLGWAAAPWSGATLAPTNFQDFEGTVNSLKNTARCLRENRIRRALDTAIWGAIAFTGIASLANLILAILIKWKA